MTGRRGRKESLPHKNNKKQKRQSTKSFNNRRRRETTLLLIADKGKLLASQTSKHAHKRYFCDYCVNGFHSEESLAIHMEHCTNNGAVRQILPWEGTFAKFENSHKSMKVPFVVNADFEFY